MHRDSIPARRRYTRLTGSADALALSRLAAAEKPLAVVTATALDAQRLREEIARFAPPFRLCLLPCWETLPFDPVSPHPDPGSRAAPRPPPPPPRRLPLPALA